MSFGFGFSLPTLGWHLSGGGASSGYSVTKSLRFRSSASAYLNRTAGTPTAQTKYTISVWVKRGTSTFYSVFSAGSASANDYDSVQFNSASTLAFFTGPGAGTADLVTTQLFRDFAAWYHIIVAVDTTQATASNRVKIYVNGAQVTSFSTATYPSLNGASAINRSGAVQAIGALYSGSYNQYLDGELAEFNFIDGQQLAPTAFGAYSTYNQWLPIRYAGTYGTNGFYLPFSATSASSYAGSFNGSTQYLTVPNNAAFTLGTTATMEAWIYVTSTTGNKRIVTTGANIDSFDFGLYTSTNTVFVAGGNANTTTAIPLNTWVHVAAVFNSGTLAIYFNGIAQSLSGVTTGYNLVASTLSAVFIGGQNAANFPGQISNLRVVKGTAVYTANFVPPTTALTAVTNTSLLTLQNATIVDNSTNAFTITNVGTVVTSVQSPFLNPTVLTADSSGNANNWTPNNISLTAGSTYDSLTDVPTLTSATVANYCVINPLSPTLNSGTISNGNLKSAGAFGGSGCIAYGTIGVTSGKFYFEVESVSNAGHGQVALGIYTNNSGLVKYSGDGGDTGYTTYGTYGVAFDVDAGKLWYRNSSGSWVSGDPAAGTSPTSTFTVNLITFPYSETSRTSGFNENGIGNWNFGQQPFTYTPPTGFLALNTYNI